MWCSSCHFTVIFFTLSNKSITWPVSPGQLWRPPLPHYEDKTTGETTQLQSQCRHSRLDELPTHAKRKIDAKIDDGKSRTKLARKKKKLSYAHQ